MNLRARLALMPRGSLVPVSWLLEELDRDPGATGQPEGVCQSATLGDLTVEDVGQRMKRSPNTVRDWIRTGQLRAYRLQGRQYKITEAALAEFLEAQRSGEEQPRAERGKPADLGSWRNVRRAG